jgi:hypothetical protein
MVEHDIPGDRLIAGLPCTQAANARIIATYDDILLSEYRPLSDVDSQVGIRSSSLALTELLQEKSDPWHTITSDASRGRIEIIR